MGNREDLLAGARRCLVEKGYARTTARDIASAAGTSLAAIGYHFKTTEALMNEALNASLEEWGGAMERAVKSMPPGATQLERFEWLWARMIDSFEGNRAMLAASFEVFPLLDRVAGLREMVAGGMDDARGMWAMLFEGLDAKKDPKTARAVGSFYQALISGVMAQWMLDPARAPSAKEMTLALQVIAKNVSKSARKVPAVKATKPPAKAKKTARRR